MAIAKIRNGRDSVAKSDEKEKQIEAIGKVYAAIKDLSPKAAQSVLSYVRSMVVTDSDESSDEESQNQSAFAGELEDPKKITQVNQRSENLDEGKSSGDEGDGISGVGHKWMKRNGIQSEQLGTIFSLGLDEIDLVAKKVPGKSTKERMRNVFLLKGFANYLGSGAARFTHEQVREVCQHYDAWDTANLAVYLKSFASDVGGSKENGYNLTNRGLTSGTELIKNMAHVKNDKEK